MPINNNHKEIFMNNELKDSITKEDFIINYSKIILLTKLSILYMKNNPPVYGEGFLDFGTFLKESELYHSVAGY